MPITRSWQRDLDQRVYESDLAELREREREARAARRAMAWVERLALSREYSSPELLAADAIAAGCTAVGRELRRSELDHLAKAARLFFEWKGALTKVRRAMMGMVA